MAEVGWFAECDETGWQPYAQTEWGHFPLEVWFPTEQACESFIREQIVGLGILNA